MGRRGFLRYFWEILRFGMIPFAARLRVMDVRKLNRSAARRRRDRSMETLLPMTRWLGLS